MEAFRSTSLTKKKVKESQPNSDDRVVTETNPNQLLSRPILPNKSPSPEPTSLSSNQLKLPDGWILLTKDFFSQKKNNIAPKSIQKYLEVRNPSWADIVSEQIPERKIVDEELVDNLKRDLDYGFRMTVLLGSGCSGKSTALYQAVYKLFKQNSKYQIIWWKYTPEIDDIKKCLLFLPKLDSEQKWLIFYDSPSRKEIKDIHLLFSGKEGLNREDIQILFSCRTTVWETYCEKLFWDKYPRQKIYMPHLQPKELEIILEKWQNEGLLDAQRKEYIQKKLLEKAKVEEYVFLAAILLCKNQTIDSFIEERITHILNDLADKSKAKNILDTYAFIVAMHKEELNFLTQKVLVEAIQYDPTKFRRDILNELGNEIIISNEDEPISTSHQIIAEAVYEIMPRLHFQLLPDYEVDFEHNIYPGLAQAAQNLVEKGLIAKKGNEINNWQYTFPKHFAESKPPRMSLAIRIADNLFEVGRIKELLTHLAQLYRTNQQYDLSSQLFREKFFADRDRKYYHEWSIAERDSQNYPLSAWLCAIALADSTNPSLDPETTVIYLSDMGYAFWHLQMKPNDVYAKALGASAQLAYRIAPTVNFKDREKKRMSINDLEKNLDRAKKPKVSILKPTKFQELFNSIKNGIQEAYKLSVKEGKQDERKKVPDGLENFNQLTFQTLEEILKSSKRR